MVDLLPHHHDHGEEGHEHQHSDTCGCGHDHSHGHHHADDIFKSWGRETPRKYSREDLQEILSALSMGEQYGIILRAKGMLPCADGKTWLHFDLVPGEFQLRDGSADYTGRICVIGTELDEQGLATLFQLN